jgi:hypothetical protein
MQEKVIKIPFNRHAFLESHKNAWSFFSKKHVKSYLIYTALSISILVMGFVFNLHSIFPIEIVVGSGMVVYLFFKWAELFEKRSEYFKKAKSHALHYENEAMDFTYIFSDNNFEYFDKEKSVKFIWPLFQSFIIYRDNIILILKDGRGNFTINKSQLISEEYNELCDILNNKIV